MNASAKALVLPESRNEGISRADFLASLGLLPSVPVTAIPRIPVVYTEAVKAIAACRTLDESKHWSDKADVLAAWAKIYRDDEVALEAKRLKLHAFRRMSELAEALRPQLYANKGGHRPVKFAGPVSLLREQGFTRSQCATIRAVGKLKPSQFESALKGAVGPSKARLGVCKGSAAWKQLVLASNGIQQWAAYCSRNDAATLARGLSGAEQQKARKLLRKVRAWIAVFEKSCRGAEE